MNYTIESNTSGGVKLTKGSAGTVMFALMLAISGFGLLLGIPIFAMEQSGTGGVLAGMGIVFLSGAFFLRNNTAKLPDFFFFNNLERNLEIHCRTGKPEKLPYSELSGFRLEELRRSGYVASVYEKDGSRIDLAQFNGKAKTEEYTEALSRSVMLQSNVETEAPIPEAVRALEKEGETTYFWKEKMKISDFAMAISLFGGMGMAVASGLGPTPVVVYSVVGVFTILFLVSLSYMVRSCLKFSILSVNAHEIKFGYVKKAPGDGVFTAKKSLPTASVAAISHGFENSAGTFRIWILDKKSVETFQAVQTGIYEMKKLPKLIRDYPGLFALTFFRFDTAQLVGFIRHLRNTARKYGAMQ